MQHVIRGVTVCRGFPKKRVGSSGKRSDISGKMDVEVLPVSSAVVKKTSPAIRHPTSSSVTITPIFRPLLAGASKRKSATPTRTATAASTAVQMEPVDLSVRHDSDDDDDKAEEVGFATGF